MARTKLVKISPSNVAVARALGLAVESTNTYVVLDGTPDEALAALRQTMTAHQFTDRGEQQAARTLERKLEQRKAEYVKVLDAEQDGDGQGADADTQAEAQQADITPAEVVEAHSGREPKQSKQKKAKAEPKAKEPKRPALPEGYVSVMGLTHEINRRGLYEGKRADGLLTGQSLYTYIKANGPDSKHPFPIGRIDDQVAIELEAGIAWWVAKNERAANRAASRAKKNDPSNATDRN